MFEEFSHPDTFKRPMLKWLLLFLTIILIAAVLASAFRFKWQSSEQIQDEETVQDYPLTDPLSSIDEDVLQGQIQEIIATGKEADCDTLGDLRYQSACRGFFAGKIEEQGRSDTQTTPPTLQDQPPAVIEAFMLQEQLRKILSEGKESDCDTLGDAQYRLACHDFFKTNKEEQ